MLQTKENGYYNKYSFVCHQKESVYYAVYLYHITDWASYRKKPKGTKNCATTERSERFSKFDVSIYDIFLAE